MTDADADEFATLERSPQSGKQQRYQQQLTRTQLVGMNYPVGPLHGDLTQRREDAETQRGSWGRCGACPMLNFGVLRREAHDGLIKLGTREPAAAIDAAGSG